MADLPLQSRLAHRFDRELYPASPNGEPPREDIEADWSGTPLQRPVATTIAALRSNQVFLLLGELGVGKTWLFEHESLRLQAAGEKHVHFVRLGEFSDLADLDSETFNRADVVAAHRNKETVHLFLDSLDQGVILMPPLHNWLYRRIRDNHAYSNVRIRISSRLVPHARTLASNLADLFQTSQSDIAVYVGLLTKDEVIREARARRIGANKFVQAVATRNAEALAVHPLTLGLLLKEYQRTHRLASDLVELYQSACTVLTQEHETGPALGAPAAGNVAYALTGRIAALMAITGSPLFSVAPTVAMPESAIGPEVVTSLPEIINGQSVAYTYGQVRYVLTNAQFQAGALDAYRWIHLSLESFMAAQWLAGRLDPEQLLGLLIHPLDRRGQIRVDLEETAAWLAGMVPSIREYLIRVQPLVLLTSQSQAGALGDPAGLLRTLLLANNAMLVRWRNVRDVRLRRLRSPELNGILRPALAPDADQETQWLALAIIRQTRAKGFDNALLRLIEDPDVTEFVAVSAGLALEVAGSVTARRKIATKLRTADAAQLPDEIKAVLLRSSWPQFISASTLFRLLTPSRDDVLGLYDTLPAKWILDNLKPSDIVHAIDWVAVQEFSGYVPTTRVQLVDGILRLAISNMDRTDVKSSMVHLVHQMGRSELPFQGVEALAALRESSEVTRALLIAAVESSEKPAEFIRSIVWQVRPVMNSMNWLLTAYQRAKTSAQRDAWIWLIERTPPGTKSELQRLRSLARKDSRLVATAKTAAVVPRSVPDPNRAKVVDTAQRTDTADQTESTQKRLIASLERWSTDRQSAVDIADLVWKSGGDAGVLPAIRGSLSPEIRKQLDRFFARQLGPD